MQLYLKDAPVFDIDTATVLDEARFPGLLRKNPSRESFKQWMKYRRSEDTNSLAGALREQAFGQEGSTTIDKETHAFSLSDSYWIAPEGTDLKFRDCSPYFADFWKGKTEYTGGAVPTLYANGFLSKCWISSRELYKAGETSKIEVECSYLARSCGIPCANVVHSGDGVLVRNFTTADVMLEAADMSGQIDPDDFDENDIIRLFGLRGFQMILLDAVFGNGDRHAGNFGFLRDSNTGAYLGMAPIYDFDHALDARGMNDRLLRDCIAIAQSREDFLVESRKVCQAIVVFAKNQVFKERARVFLAE